MATTGVFEVDPISRIEGHLGAKVTVANGVITEANAHGNLWRGFENFLVGRDVNDAITFTQRICGVCPVPHGTAATMAADSVLGVSKGYVTFRMADDAVDSGYGIPKAAVLVRNIVLGSEFLMSSLVHFYHLVAQSYVQGPPVPPWTPYFADSQYDPNLKVNSTNGLPVVDANGVPVNLWSAVIKQYVKALRIRRLTFEAGAMFAGRMPMMSNSVAGGVTNRFVDRADFIKKTTAYKTLMNEVAQFVATEYVPLVLALGALYKPFDNTANGGSGFGGGLGNFFAYGGFPNVDGASPDDDTLAVKGGYKLGAAAAVNFMTKGSDLDTAIQAIKDNLTESIAHSRYANSFGYETSDVAYPGKVTRTEPVRDQDAAGKYSWLKAPRWDGNAMEVGPLARLAVNGKYPVDGTTLIGTAVPALYLASGGGLDLRLVHGDLVAGLVGAGLSGANKNPSGDLSGAVVSWIEHLNGGLSTMDRLRARALESFHMCTWILGTAAKDANGKLSFSGGWIDQLEQMWPDGGAQPRFYRHTTPPIGSVSGFGLVEAPRGALGHFVTADSGKIKSYQCVVPTTWNGSPKDGVAITDAVAGTGADGKKHRGAIEQALVGCAFDGTPVVAGTVAHPGVSSATDPQNQAPRDYISGVEVLRVAQSFDPCIACAVH